MKPAPSAIPASLAGKVLAVSGAALPHAGMNASLPMHGSAPAQGGNTRSGLPGLGLHGQNVRHVDGGTEDAERQAFADAARRADRPLSSRHIAWQKAAGAGIGGRVRSRANVYARKVGGAANPRYKRDLDTLRARFDADAAPGRTLEWLEETEPDPARRHALMQDLLLLVRPDPASADPGRRADMLATAIDAHRARFREQIELFEDIGRALRHCPDANPATARTLRDAYFAAVGGLDANTVLHPVTMVQAMRGVLSELGRKDLRTTVDELDRAMGTVHANARATRFPGDGSHLALAASSLVVHLRTALVLCEEGVRKLDARGVRLAQEAANTTAKQVLGMTLSPLHPAAMQALVESLAGQDRKAGLALSQEILAVVRQLDDAIWPSPAARDGVVQTVLQSCERLQHEPAAGGSAPMPASVVTPHAPRL